jgi:hypothetical protein
MTTPFRNYTSPDELALQRKRRTFQRGSVRPLFIKLHILIDFLQLRLKKKALTLKRKIVPNKHMGGCLTPSI